MLVIDIYTLSMFKLDLYNFSAITSVVILVVGVVFLILSIVQPNSEELRILGWIMIILGFLSLGALKLYEKDVPSSDYDFQ